MPEIDFYLLSANKGSRFMFANRITHKAYQQQYRVYIQVNNPDEAEQIDRSLWEFADLSFIPHCKRQENMDWREFPVQIGSDDCADDNIDVLVCMADNAPTNWQGYARIVEIVDQDEAYKRVSRSKFKHYQQAGLSPNVHRLD